MGRRGGRCARGSNEGVLDKLCEEQLGSEIEVYVRDEEEGGKEEGRRFVEGLGGVVACSGGSSGNEFDTLSGSGSDGRETLKSRIRMLGCSSSFPTGSTTLEP